MPAGGLSLFRANDSLGSEPYILFDQGTMSSGGRLFRGRPLTVILSDLVPGLLERSKPRRFQFLRVPLVICIVKVQIRIHGTIQLEPKDRDPSPIKEDESLGLLARMSPPSVA